MLGPIGATSPTRQRPRLSPARRPSVTCRNCGASLPRCWMRNRPESFAELPCWDLRRRQRRRAGIAATMAEMRSTAALSVPKPLLRCRTGRRVGAPACPTCSGTTRFRNSQLVQPGLTASARSGCCLEWSSLGSRPLAADTTSEAVAQVGSSDRGRPWTMATRSGRLGAMDGV